MNFVIMKLLFKTKIIGMLFLLLGLAACKPEIQRYIADDDTSYSEDVRFASAKINKDPKNPELYYQRSNAFFFEDKFKDALADIEVSITISPNNAYYHFRKAEYLMAGDTADAIQAEKSYLKTIELEPEMEEARYRYGVLLFAKQKYEETAEQMNAIIKQNSANPDALFMIGMINKEKGDTIRAILRFQETVEANNTYYNAYMQLALLMIFDNPDLAMRYVDNALRVDEFSDEAHYTKGILLQNKGEFKAASEFYKRTTELNPGHRLAYYNLAYLETEMESGTLFKALDYLEKLLIIDPEYVPALHFRSAIYVSLKKFDAAKKDLRNAIEFEPDNQDLKDDLAKLP